MVVREKANVLKMAISPWLNSSFNSLFVYTSISTPIFSSLTILEDSIGVNVMNFIFLASSGCWSFMLWTISTITNGAPVLFNWFDTITIRGPRDVLAGNLLLYSNATRLFTLSFTIIYVVWKPSLRIFCATTRDVSFNDRLGC